MSRPSSLKIYILTSIFLAFLQFGCVLRLTQNLVFVDAITRTDPAGLQYERDVMNWLSETHVRYGVGVSVDLTRRINELHDLVST